MERNEEKVTVEMHRGENQGRRTGRRNRERKVEEKVKAGDFNSIKLQME